MSPRLATLVVCLLLPFSALASGNLVRCDLSWFAPHEHPAKVTLGPSFAFDRDTELQSTFQINKHYVVAFSKAAGEANVNLLMTYRDLNEDGHIPVEGDITDHATFGFSAGGLNLNADCRVVTDRELLVEHFNAANVSSSPKQ